MTAFSGAFSCSFLSESGGELTCRPSAGELCDPAHPELGMTGAYVDDDPNAMCEYTYMADHMGNIVGLVDCENETGHRQVFDAFGNVIGDFALLHCAADHDWTDIPCHLATMGLWAPPVCPRPPAQPIARLQTGGFNWRGNEGSVTDRVTEDMVDSETFELRWSAYERPSTGFVYMQARYYEPATGRFLTADAVPYDLMPLASGQNNRWVYCGNDPVNLTDPSGQLVGLFAVIGIILLVFALLFALLAVYLWTIRVRACKLGSDPNLLNDIDNSLILATVISGILAVLGSLGLGVGYSALAAFFAKGLIGATWWALLILIPATGGYSH